jgi:hypothetical protein
MLDSMRRYVRHRVGGRRAAWSLTIGALVLIGAACAAPLPPSTGKDPATSVVRPELLAGGQSPTRPPLSPAVADHQF